jgi:hypothetical protein
MRGSNVRSKPRRRIGAASDSIGVSVSATSKRKVTMLSSGTGWQRDKEEEA